MQLETIRSPASQKKRLEQCTQRLPGPVQARLDGSGSNPQVLRRLVRVELFDVPKKENGPVRLGQPVDTGLHLGSRLFPLDRVRLQAKAQ
jgi:hypothetical protein